MKKIILGFVSFLPLFGCQAANRSNVASTPNSTNTRDICGVFTSGSQYQVLKPAEINSMSGSPFDLSFKATLSNLTGSTDLSFQPRGRGRLVVQPAMGSFTAFSYTPFYFQVQNVAPSSRGSESTIRAATQQNGATATTEIVYSGNPFGNDFALKSFTYFPPGSNGVGLLAIPSGCVGPLADALPQFGEMAYEGEYPGEDLPVWALE